MPADWTAARAISKRCAADGVRVERLRDGLRFALRGGRSAAPAPTVFLFALDCETTLADPRYNGLAVALAADGYVGVSLDLPGHGEDTRPHEPAGLGGWRARADRDEPLVSPFVAQASAVLDRLIQDGYTDPARVAASGVSRGAFAAFHVAAADHRIRCALGFSPVTDLLALSEFQGRAPDESVRCLGLCSLAGALAGRKMWLCIGADDRRVGTDRAIAFARSLAAASRDAGLPPQIELHVMPSAGHAVPDGARDLAVRWLRKQMAGGA